jgi:cytochrome bd-type quinol oxidase subunit 1
MQRPLGVSMQTFHLSYTPDRADFAAVLAAERTPAMLRMIFFAGVVAMSSGLGWLSEHNALFAALNAWAPPWGEFATLVAMVAVMYAVLIALRRLSRNLRAARAAAAAVPLAVTADDVGITVTEAGRREVHPWSAIRTAWRDGDHAFVALGGRRLAFPRRAFADAAAMDTFADAAAERVRAEGARPTADDVVTATTEAVR